MTDDPRLSSDLHRALDDAVDGVTFAAIRTAATRISEMYRNPAGRAEHGSSLSDELVVLAYLTTRMPATLAVARAVLRELRDRCPGLGVKRLLDLGAGPGTTLWAAGFEIPELVHASLVEPAATMVTAAQGLLRDSSLERRVEVSWFTGATDVPPANEPYDLVVVGYLLTELDASAQRALVSFAWEKCRGAVVVILPGSTEGFRAMLGARLHLLSLGATVVAPCPHAEPCPLPEGDWCHFGVRLNRSGLHRRLKGGTLPYEDEKYSYVIATRGVGQPASARVIRRPRKADRRVTLPLCGADGLRTEVVTRGARVAYRQARKARWGDGWADR